MRVVTLLPAILTFTSVLARPYVVDDDLLPRDEDVYIQSRDMDWGLEDRDVDSQLYVRDFDSILDARDDEDMVTRDASPGHEHLDMLLHRRNDELPTLPRDRALFRRAGAISENDVIRNLGWHWKNSRSMSLNEDTKKFLGVGSKELPTKQASSLHRFQSIPSSYSSGAMDVPRKSLLHQESQPLPRVPTPSNPEDRGAFSPKTPNGKSKFDWKSFGYGAAAGSVGAGGLAAGIGGHEHQKHKKEHTQDMQKRSPLLDRRSSPGLIPFFVQLLAA